MKKIALLGMLLLAIPGLAQKKGKVDPKDAKIDSLMKVTTAQTAKLDSLTKNAARYTSMHAAIKDKVIKYDFAPERTGELIDSLKTAREKTFSTLTTDAKACNDSLVSVSSKNAELQAKMDEMVTASKNNEVVIAQLRELKGLLDEGILTQAEYDARKAKIMKGW